MAIEKLIEKGRLIAAHLLQAPADQVSFADGRFVVQGTERAIEIGKVADAARDAANLPEGLTPGLEGSATNSSDLYNFPNGCHVAEVEIDPDTGVVRLDRYTIVDDFGSLINPRVALSQVHGGVAQGIGQSLLEHVVFDPEGPAAQRLLHGLHAAARAGSAEFRRRPESIGADQVESARRQGNRAGRQHRRAANHHERRARCVVAARHR